MMNRIKRIGLVAHDNRKKDLIEWVEWNYLILIHHHLICTGTTGKLIEEAIQQKLHVDEAERFSVRKLKSGPLGGDQQLGALIAGGEIDFLIFPEFATFGKTISDKKLNRYYKII